MYFLKLQTQKNQPRRFQRKMISSKTDWKYNMATQTRITYITENMIDSVEIQTANLGLRNSTESASDCDNDRQWQP